METKINQDEIIIGKYKPDTPNPSVASTYSRNSYGTIVVDDNVSGIESKKLVVNLVGTRYNNNSFINVLDTDFEEFLDPEIKIPEKIEETEDLSGTILALQAQLESEKLKNNSNQAIINQLQNAITNAQQAAITSIEEGLAPAADKKARIFSDNTLLRDKNDLSFFYIVEAGRKRRFTTSNRNELVEIVAKSIGKTKIKPDGTVLVDFIEVSQEVLDDIPSGQPFTNFDLVKDVNTPALPALDLDGKNIIAKWVDSSPITIEVSTLNDLNALSIDLDLQMTTSEGSINYLYVLDLPINASENDVDGWYQGRLPLLATRIDSTEPNSIRRFTIPLGKTGNDDNTPFSSNSPLQPLSLNVNTPTITIPITAKLFNDNDGVGFSNTKYITIKLIPKVPYIIGKTITQASNMLAVAGLGLDITDSEISFNPTNYQKIKTQNPAVGAILAPGNKVEVTIYVVSN